MVPTWIYRSKSLMKFRDCSSMNSTENIQEGYRNGPLKNGFRIKQPCAYQRACALKLPTPRLITWLQLRRFLQNVVTIDFRLILQFPASGKKHRIASMFIITRAVSTPRDVERRESGSMFYETIEIISWSSKESSRKHENIALKSTMTKQWNSLIPHYN